MEYTWIPFYEELADKLLAYKNKRGELLNLLRQYEDVLPSLKEGGNNAWLSDIDPFTVIALATRMKKAKESCENFWQRETAKREALKNIFKLKSAIPSDDLGQPHLLDINARFFGKKNQRKEQDIDNLWELFERIITNQDFRKEFDKVRTQFCIKHSFTSALFWIRPNRFMTLDRNSRLYLREYSISVSESQCPTYDEYMAIIDEIKEKIKSGEIEEKSFCELSHAALKGDNIDYFDEKVNMWKQCKNMVFYGAPGTGKTYEIPEYVVRLCDPTFSWDNRTELMERYNRLKEEGRVMFTTFHQSMDYEDWMEGLRPVVEDGQVHYEIEDGIFKRLCRQAEQPIASNEIGIARDATIWKVSLFGTGDNPIRTDCMKNNYIRIGWDEYGAEISDETNWSIRNGEGKRILEAFVNEMKEGDVVLSCYSNKTIDAIGVVTGPYEWKDSLKEYKRTRKVKWLLKGINEDILAMNKGKVLTLSTVYRLNKISLEDVKSLLERNNKTKVLTDNTQPYVMVIDEINRGNVSKIFGELITLLEADKRKGCNNAESVVLPYSKEEFQVPENVYVIATMNTADRSLASLDYALRRRFAFISSLPYRPSNINFDFELFRKVSELFIKNFEAYSKEYYQNSDLLERADTLSKEYNPEEVWIGQSYFIAENENVLQDKLTYGLLPILREYLRDGVLKPSAKSKIDEIAQHEVSLSEE